jgi:hypothetical protein
MRWNTVTVAADRLAAFLETIRRSGGTITSSRPQVDGVHVTWTSPSGPSVQGDAEHRGRLGDGGSGGVGSTQRV